MGNGGVETEVWKKAWRLFGEKAEKIKKEGKEEEKGEKRKKEE